jgi:hypothetical protein
VCSRCVERDWDPARGERGTASADGDEPEHDPDKAAGQNLRCDDAAAPRRHQEGRSDRAVADFAGDRQRADEPGEERAKERPEPKHLHLVGDAVESVGGKAEGVQQDGQENEGEHGEKEPEVGERRPVLELSARREPDRRPAARSPRRRARRLLSVPKENGVLGSSPRGGP